eukprot:49907-Pyramimonas_sp.AAC.1
MWSLGCKQPGGMTVNGFREAWWEQKGGGGQYGPKGQAGKRPKFIHCVELICASFLMDLSAVSV